MDDERRQGMPPCHLREGCLHLFVLHTAGAEVKIGTPVKGLTFKDIRYLNRSLDDLPKGKAYVLAFTSTTCPLARSTARPAPSVRSIVVRSRRADAIWLASARL